MTVPEAEKAVRAAEAAFARSGIVDGMEAWSVLKQARADLEEAQRQVDIKSLTSVLTGKTKIDGRTITIDRAARLYSVAVAVLERHIARQGATLGRVGLHYATESLRLNRDRLEHVQRRMARGQELWAATGPAVAA
jgi:acyl-CoA reductase-like NAD-dependent aldehyde dehydrogenase